MGAASGLDKRMRELMLNAMLAQGMIAATLGLVMIAMCSDLQFVGGTQVHSVIEKL
jgi:hypothetical protein